MVPIFIGALIFTFLNRMESGNQNRVTKEVMFGIKSSAILICAFIYFFTFQFSHFYNVWGSWWYANLFSLLYVILLTFLLMFLWQSMDSKLTKIFITLVIVIFTSSSLVYATYRNNIFKIENLTRKYTPHQIFRTTFNMYEHYHWKESWQRNTIKFAYTWHWWQEKKHHTITPLPSDEEMSKCLFLDNHKKYLAIEVP